MKVRLALLALLLTACGGEAQIRVTKAGGDPGTVLAPTATATPTPTDAPASATEAFRTPTGRLACTILDNGLTCDVRRQEGDTGYPTPDTDISQECDELAKTSGATASRCRTRARRSRSARPTST